MGPEAMILVFWMLSFKQFFHSPLSPSSRGSFVPLSFLPLGYFHLHIWGYWYFSHIIGTHTKSFCSDCFLCLDVFPCCCSVTQSCLTMQSHRLQPTRLPCPSLSLGVCSNSHPLSHWCHPNISSSVALFASCPQSFLASRSFAMSWLFILGGQSIEASALVSHLYITTGKIIALTIWIFVGTLMSL